MRPSGALGDCGVGRASPSTVLMKVCSLANVPDERFHRECSWHTASERLLRRSTRSSDLHFRNVLGDALRAEWRFARRLSRVTRRYCATSCSPRARFFCCEVLPELPSIQGWVEAMTSLGRLIFFDQPGTGVSDPVTPGALPTLEQWADSITAVLDDLGSSEAVLLAVGGALRHGGALRGDTSVPHHRAGRAPGLSRIPLLNATMGSPRRICSLPRQPCGERARCNALLESGHAVERGDPGNLGPDGAPDGEPRDR